MSPGTRWGAKLEVWARIKSVIRAGEWFDALNVIEETVKYLIRYQDSWTNNIGEVLADAFNDRFETYLVGYRFIGKELTPVDTTLQSDTIQAAIASTGSLAGVRHSLERATELLADRIKPDYPNSIKESISAVEALVKVMTGKGELSKGLSQLEDSGVVLHPALKAAWIKMYGWTSDADGIRHGGIDAASADQALAKYILVTCSAFVSYLIETGRKAGIPLD